VTSFGRRRRWLPGALLAGAVVLAAAAPAVAHGPVHKKSRTALPPGAKPAPSAPVSGQDLAPPVQAPAGVVPATGARPLRLLAADAQAVVLADVTRTESFDEDRLRLHRLRVERVLRGRLDGGDAAVVELRGGGGRTPLLTEGEHAVLLLRPAPPLTYLAQHLPEGRYLEPVSGRDGVVAVASDADVEALEAVIREGARIAGLAPAEAATARRALAFTELGAPTPRLVHDGVLELRSLPALAPLAPEEVDVLRRVLRDTRVAAPTRVAVLELLAARDVRDALPAVAGAATDTPAVLDAVLAARARLGAPAGRAELVRLLGSADPAIQAAAVRALGRLDDPQALADLGRWATGDAQLRVREAAVEALGASKKPEALPVLRQTFGAPERELKQASARAMIEIGGPAMDDALVDLALRGDSPETQRYAALVLLAARGRDHPAVRRIETSNPSPEVRDLLEHGLEFRDAHPH
jgi:HEAT repeat protein